MRNALLAGAVLASIGCAESGAVRNLSEAKVASPPTAPRIAQVATASQIAGAMGSDQDALLGYSVAVADFNGDGFGDVAAGMPGAEGQRGAVAIVFGNANGMDLNNRDLSTRTRLTAGALTGFTERAGDQTGYAITAGDFDADGYMDLAIGMPFRHVNGNAGAGQVAVVYGSAQKGAAGFARRIERFTQGEAGRNEANDHFGMTLAAGDFDGDGYQDLAIGAPDEDEESNNRNDSGAVFIRYGSSTGLTSRDYHFITAASRSPGSGANSTQAGERFGASLAATQLHATADNRRLDDLVVGAPGKTVPIYSASAGFGDVLFPGCGQAYVFYGATLNKRLAHKLDILPGAWPRGVRGFGSALAMGDFDGDGHNDLAVGSPDAGEDHDHSGGQVFVAMHNDINGGVGARAFPDERNTQYRRRCDQILTEAPIAKVENGDRYGYALAAADFNGDGFSDLAVGAPWEDWSGEDETGLIFIFMGASDGLAPSFGCEYHFIDQSPRGATEPRDRFGFALAAGKVNRDNFPDLVIGTPYENHDAGANSGAVFLALTSTVASGPFDGIWTGTVSGDNGTSATLTLYLCDRDAKVTGSGFLDRTLEKNACFQTIALGREADVNATKTNSNSRTATGNLVNLELPEDVEAVVFIDLTVSNDNNTLTGSIRVRNVELGGVSVPCNTDLNNIRLARAN